MILCVLAGVLRDTLCTSWFFTRFSVYWREYYEIPYVLTGVLWSNQYTADVLRNTLCTVTRYPVYWRDYYNILYVLVRILWDTLCTGKNTTRYSVYWREYYNILYVLARILQDTLCTGWRTARRSVFARSTYSVMERPGVKVACPYSNPGISFRKWANPSNACSVQRCIMS